MDHLIEHSENKIVTQSGLFENEIGPGVLNSSIQQIRLLEEYQMHKPSVTEYVSILSKFCEIFADCMFSECWTGALKVQPRSRNT